jgi:hypothetical protein
MRRRLFWGLFPLLFPLAGFSDPSVVSGLDLPPEARVIWAGEAGAAVIEEPEERVFGLAVERDGRRWSVQRVTPGSPAELAGLRTGDLIVEIDGRSSYWMTERDLFERLREAESIEFFIRRAGSGAQRIRLQRAEVLTGRAATLMGLSSGLTNAVEPMSLGIRLGGTVAEMIAAVGEPRRREPLGMGRERLEYRHFVVYSEDDGERIGRVVLLSRLRLYSGVGSGSKREEFEAVFGRGAGDDRERRYRHGPYLLSVRYEGDRLRELAITPAEERFPRLGSADRREVTADDRKE